MNQTMRARANQKLYMARLSLDHWESMLARKALLSESEAFREAFLFHAVGAYHSLLGEMLELSGIDAGAETAEMAGLAAERCNKTVPELSALLQLEETRESWLSALLVKWEACWRPPSDGTVDSIENALIPVKDITSASVSFPESPDSYRTIYDSLKSLVAWVRAQMIEC